MEMEKTPLSQSKRCHVSTKTVEMWSVQCAECYKWRVIPTQEEYEQIRCILIEDPFVCTKKQNATCKDPADIDYDKSQKWVIYKPNLPKTPLGFKRLMVMRRDCSRMDCYYTAPNGKKLRASTDVVKFLEKHPEYRKDLSIHDFSFTSPKVMDGKQLEADSMTDYYYYRENAVFHMSRLACFVFGAISESRLNNH